MISSFLVKTKRVALPTIQAHIDPGKIWQNSTLQFYGDTLTEDVVREA
ncbi:MAG: hypothetical protein ACSLEL_00235 [Candidatus Malihini olakiniferum]